MAHSKTYPLVEGGYASAASTLEGNVEVQFTTDAGVTAEYLEAHDARALAKAILRAAAEVS